MILGFALVGASLALTVFALRTRHELSAALLSWVVGLSGLLSIALHNSEPLRADVQRAMKSATEINVVAALFLVFLLYWLTVLGLIEIVRRRSKG